MARRTYPCPSVSGNERAMMVLADLSVCISVHPLSEKDMVARRILSVSIRV